MRWPPNGCCWKALPRGQPMCISTDREPKDWEFQPLWFAACRPNYRLPCDALLPFPFGKHIRHQNSLVVYPFLLVRLLTIDDIAFGVTLCNRLFLFRHDDIPLLIPFEDDVAAFV